MSQQAYHTTRTAVNTGPSTREDVAHVGRITVALYRRWQNAGGGYTVVARNGHELERYDVTTEPAARATFNALVDRYTPECGCYDLPDARAYICAACRQRINVEVF